MEEEVITINRPKSFRVKIAEFFSNPKKRLIFIIVCGVVLLSAVGTGLYFMTKDDSQKVEVATKTEKEPETRELHYGQLDGLPTDLATSTKHPLAVMIENHVQARPQAGLDKASVVYEAIAEGGITRFMALFSTFEADKIGPVRSSRPYYLDWALGYNAYYAHVGGNYNALEQIKTDGVLDLDQFRYSSAYWREKTAGVATEHTMFSSTLKLRTIAESLNYTKENKFKVYKFASPDGSNEATPLVASTSDIAATSINVNFSTPNFNVVYNYDQNRNIYQRTLAGKTQKDRVSGAEISPTNLIVMTVNRSPLVTKINEHGYTMSTIGSGQAVMFIGGKAITGKWVKSSKTEREVFYDNNNNEIVFNRGQTWISVIPPESGLTYN